MRILIDITHPAHVHFFRNTISELKKKGNSVAVTARDTSIIVRLLNEYNIKHTVLHAKGTARILAPSRLLIRDLLLWRFCRRFKPDALTAIAGVFIAHVGKLINKPSIIWDDTEHYSLSHKITWPFATAIHSPDCYYLPPIRKQTFYPGCHELAYLHPNRFAPDPKIVRSLGINPNQKYCIIRFSSFQAQHDIGQHGFCIRDKIKLIKEIERYAKPYISSEGKLIDELKKYQMKTPFKKIHHIMAFASLCVTEGATMASESAILGIPTIFVNTLKLGNIEMLENDYHLMKQSLDIKQILDQSLDWLKDDSIKESCEMERHKLITDKIDVTDYIVKVLEQNS